MTKKRSIIDIQDLSVAELDDLIATSRDIIADPAKYSEICRGKKLATLFFEPSTRTRMSFEAAMYELGGSVITMAGAGSSSAAKGESVADTAKIVSGYVDIIAMRHPKEGAAYVAAVNASIPVINAGDGGHCHPTQTLADLLTISREKGGFENLTVGICGDLKYGRTVHSLINAMIRYAGVKFVLISPEELRLPAYIRENVLDAGAISYRETKSLEEAIPELDVLYMTRIQRERFTDEAEYQRLKNSYVLTQDKLTSAKPDMIILHPLPRVNEISVAVDEDPRAAYFRQALNGKYMRMALILKLLGLTPEIAGAKCTETPASSKPETPASSKPETPASSKPETPASSKPEAPASQNTEPGDESGLSVNEIFCTNPRCITSTEQELRHLFRPDPKRKGIYRCVYCEAEGRKQQ